jgi:hypothetical protein
MKGDFVKDSVRFPAADNTAGSQVKIRDVFTKTD